MNSWDALGESREPFFPLNVTCVGTVGRLGKPITSTGKKRFRKNGKRQNLCLYIKDRVTQRMLDTIEGSHCLAT